MTEVRSSGTTRGISHRLAGSEKEHQRSFLLEFHPIRISLAGRPPGRQVSLPAATAENHGDSLYDNADDRLGETAAMLQQLLCSCSVH